MTKYQVTIEKDNKGNEGHGWQDFITETLDADHPGEAQVMLLHRCFKRDGWNKATAHVPIQLDS